MYEVQLQTQTDLVEKREETFYRVFAVRLTIGYKLEGDN